MSITEKIDKIVFNVYLTRSKKHKAELLQKQNT